MASHWVAQTRKPSIDGFLLCWQRTRYKRRGPGVNGPGMRAVDLSYQAAGEAAAGFAADNALTLDARRLLSRAALFL